MEIEAGELTHPVVIFIYNRPLFVKELIESLSKSKPTRLYIVADGPKTPDEITNCNQARNALTQIDWECEVFTNFSAVNMGLLDRVTSGIDWVFSRENSAIFLEDDCLPSASFLHFASECLDKYEHDNRVGMISGNNFQLGTFHLDTSYTFASLPRIWGWATWKSRWARNVNSIEEWRHSEQKAKLLSERFRSPTQRRHWRLHLDSDSASLNWDYQWVARNFLEGWLSIVPATNLVTNVGVGADATHTRSRSVLMQLPTGELHWPLIHPTSVGRDSRWDICELWSLRAARIVGANPTLIGLLHRRLALRQLRLNFDKN